jgi:protein-L-isoaspartate(D-aspartate) O-methyltransferase
MAEAGPGHERAVSTASFVLSLRSGGIRDIALLRAMELVPRDRFAPRRFADLARADMALPLPCGQTMTAPRVVAAMLVALRAGPGQRILEIGTGTGYVTALLRQLGAEVTSIERYHSLAESASGHLRGFMGKGSATVEVGDGLADRPSGSFDRILLNGTLEEIPEHLPAMLVPGGRLVGALPDADRFRLVTVERADDGQTRRDLAGRVRLAPLVRGVASIL